MVLCFLLLGGDGGFVGGLVIRFFMFLGWEGFFVFGFLLLGCDGGFLGGFVIGVFLYFYFWWEEV